MAHVLGSGDTTPAGLHAKAANLDRLHRSGLPVPPGLVLRADEPAGSPTIQQLLARGPVIARGCLALEDQPFQSSAGLGLSVRNCQTLADVQRAVHAIRNHAHGRNPQVLVQQQVPTGHIAVAACHLRREPAGAKHRGLRGVYIELYEERGVGILDGTQSPSFAGPLAWLTPRQLRPRIEELCRTVVERWAHTDASVDHGLDLEFVCTPNSEVWLVQARPLTRALAPVCSDFFATLARQTPAPDLRGLLVLDGEHNPEALSLAHRSLITWLQQHVPEAQGLRVLAGWLYVSQTPPTQRPSADTQPTRNLIVQANFSYNNLRNVKIPAARTRLDRLAKQLVHSTNARCCTLLDDALNGFAEIYRDYSHHRYGSLGRRLTSRLGLPQTAMRGSTCLFDRGAMIDVLPTTWDIQSRPLSNWLSAGDLPNAPEDPPPEMLATALGELDDHLFALGLAMVTRVYERAAQLLGLRREEVFLLGLTDLSDALQGRDLAPMLLQQKKVYAQTPRHVPQALFEGTPLALPNQRYLQGMGIGPVASGIVAQRQSLEDVLERPIGPGQVLVLPALTAQAAVVLHRQGILAVCCEYGGWMSHAAIMARELGLSALVGCRGCCSLADGMEVVVDTVRGQLTVH